MNFIMTVVYERGACVRARERVTDRSELRARVCAGGRPSRVESVGVLCSSSGRAKTPIAGEDN